MSSSAPLTERLLEILRRHIRAEDSEKTDDAFVRAVMARYQFWREQPLIDPNE
jgi:hypothetical protein